MNGFPTLLVVLLFAAPLTARAQVTADFVLPTAPFDEAAVAAQMAPGGPATLRGQVYIRPNRAPKALRWMSIKALNLSAKEYPARGTVLALYPYTPHFEEYLALRKQHEDGKKIPVVSQEAAVYRILVRITGDQGEFEVPGLRPGRYYMELMMGYTNSVVRDVPVGTITYIGRHGGPIGTGVQYEQQRFHFREAQLASAVITVQPGDTLVTAVVD